MNVNSQLKLIFSLMTCVAIFSIIHFNSQSQFEEIIKNEVNILAEKLVKKRVIHPQDLLGVDRSNISQAAISKRLIDTNPNLVPGRLTEKGPRFNDSCALYVNVLEIRHNNMYWQEQQVGNDTYFLFSSYFDNRTILKNTGPFVRIIGMLNKRNRTQNITCQFWYQKENNPTFSNVSDYHRLWSDEIRSNEDDVHPYMLSCVIPQFKGHIPESVSLVGAPCENATSNLRVIYNSPTKDKKKGFAVCVKALTTAQMPFLSIKLVEWIELNKILGAEKIQFYNFEVHPNINITIVLDHYVELGTAEVVKISLPGYLANIPDLMSAYLRQKPHIANFIEAIQYNDCLYKNMYLFEFIIIVDDNEVIIPKVVENWHNLIFTSVHKKSAASFSVSSFSFIDENIEQLDWFSGMHMLKHVHRSKNANVKKVGSFYNTSAVLALNGDLPRLCFEPEDGVCLNIKINDNDAKLHKYCIGNETAECQMENWSDMETDLSILKFKVRLMKGTIDNLQKMGLINFGVH